MKRAQFVWGVLLLTGMGIAARAQQKEPYSHLLRVYEDNDIINIPGEGTDRGYSNGTRLDYFFIKHQPARFFLTRIMPKAGDSSIDTYGWGIMQMIITPKNILKRIPESNDFPYSGALFVTHTLFSTNPVKKYNWQTQWLIGVMGPPSLAKEAQEFAHRLVGYIQPGGWDYQLKTDPLLNISVAGEKELFHINKRVACMVGVQAFAGTAFNGASVYSLIRFGKMDPYFNGYLSQYTTQKGNKSRRQIYGIVRPAVEWMLTNALIDGGIFNHGNQPVPRDDNNNEPDLGNRVRKRIIGKLDCGLVISVGRVGISVTQTTTTPQIKGTDRQAIGNISLFLAW